MASNNYIGNILEIGNYQFDSLVKKMAEPVNFLDYIYDEQVWNGLYFPGRNEMIILTGLVHGFFGIGLDFDIPASLLYGGFRTLGHEMVHGFDEIGKDYDKDGFRANWWRKNETEGYKNRTQCLVRSLQTIRSRRN